MSHENTSECSEKAYEEEKKHEGKGVEIIDGVYIKKKSLWMMAGGALGAFAALSLGKAFRTVCPAAVRTVKEGYAFKEWMAAKVERAKEDVEDVVAEAVFSYHSDVAATAEAVRREREILDKLERIVESKSARMQPENKE
jgi:hypothetical protein